MLKVVKNNKSNVTSCFFFQGGGGGAKRNVGCGSATKGRTISFLEGWGGGGVKIFLCKLFLIYAPLQKKFFLKCKLIFLHVSCLQAIY